MNQRAARHDAIQEFLEARNSSPQDWSKSPLEADVDAWAIVVRTADEILKTLAWHEIAKRRRWKGVRAFANGRFLDSKRQLGAYRREHRALRLARRD